jgi:hypothetical protein
LNGIRDEEEIPVYMLTIFTFGYWGWGSATRELIRAIDSAERKKRFGPPVFYDIRLKRNVSCKGLPR